MNKNKFTDKHRFYVSMALLAVMAGLIIGTPYAPLVHKLFLVALISWLAFIETYHFYHIRDKEEEEFTRLFHEELREAEKA